ncbi:MAG: TonB-dependent siderophore receptor [Gammaproteobacteria bacterium]
MNALAEVIIALSACLFLGTPVQAADPAPRSFDIPAQSLEGALIAFGTQSGIEILFNSDTSKDLRSPGVSGTHTPDQALRLLLEGTGLTAKVTNTGAVTLERPTADPLRELVDRAKKPMRLAEAETKPKKTSPKKATTGDTILPEMTVTASPGETGYSAYSATTATKTDTPIMETPVSIQVVPQQVLRDQQAIRLSDALKNVSGVQARFAFTQREFFTIRGFGNFGTGGLLYRDGFRVSESTYSLANAERVEVLKGPASVLFGRIEPGGLINIVTKRPLASPYYALEQQFGSFNTYRTTLDATGPITQDGTLAYRLNFEYLDQNSFRDFVAIDRIFVAPSLTWRLSERTQIDLDFIYQDEDSFVDNGIPAIGNRPAPIPIERNLGEEEFDATNSRNYDTALTLTHRFNQDWKLRGRFQAQLNDGFYGDEFHDSLDEATGTLERGSGFRNYDSEAYYGTLDVTGRLSTWGFIHNLLVGADYYDATYEEPANVSLGRTGFARPIPINIFNPVYGTVPEYRGEPPNARSIIDDRWWGVYVQDQIEVGDQWHALLGFRYDDAEAIQLFGLRPGEPVDAPTIKAQEFSPLRSALSSPPLARALRQLCRGFWRGE